LISNVATDNVYICRIPMEAAPEPGEMEETLYVEETPDGD